MRKLLITLTLAAFASGTQADAGPDRFSLLLGTKHIGSNAYNEFNPGVFATWEGERLGYTLGAFVNSYERGAVSATVHLPFWQWEHGAFGGFAGLAWYPKDGRRIGTHLGGDVIGIGGLELRHRNVFVQFVPMTDGTAKGLLSFGLTWEAGAGGAW